MNLLYRQRTAIYTAVLFCIFGGLIYLAASHYRTHKKVYDILVVQSYDANCAWKDELNRGVEDCFKRNRMHTRIRTFYMDAEALLAQAEIDTLAQLLDQYREKAPDLIISCDDEATFSLISTGHPLTYRIPIVFCGVDYVNDEILEGHTNITGFTTRPDFVQCYRLAKQLFGDIDHMAVLIEDGYLGRIYKKDLYEQCERIPELGAIEETTNDTVIVSRKPGNKPDGAASLTLQIKRVDKMPGLSLKWNLFPLPRLFHVIPRWNTLYSLFPNMGITPFLAINNEGMGDGRIGGYMTPSYDQTYEAAQTGIRILQGVRPDSLPVRPSPQVPVFDWNELQYWKIDRNRLPAGSRFINMPVTERYKEAILTAGIAGPLCIFVCLFFLIRLYKKEQGNKKEVQNRLVKEQKELSITMESISEGVISIDLKGRIYSINQAALHWLRLDGPTESYLNRDVLSLLQIVSQNDPAYLQKAFGEVLRTKESKRFAEGVYVVASEQRAFPVSGSIDRLQTDGKTVGLVITFHDITEEYTQKEILALSMIAGDVFAWRYDEPTGRLILDEAFFKATGIPDDGTHSLSRNDFIGRLHPDDLQHWRRQFVLFQKGKINKTTLQVRFRTSGPVYEWWEYRVATLFRSSLEEHYKLFGICLSIQQFKKTQQELIRFRDEAVESDRMKGVFMANMSHEIRTPLNAIVGFSTLLTENETFNPEERKTFIETINENCRLLLNLINEILDISRIESGIPFRTEPCDLNELCREIADTYRPRVAGDVEIRVELPRTTYRMVTDPLRLKQLLGNLMNNGVKFTKRGSITLSYSYDERHACCLFTVEDTGSGIPEQEIKRIFERFYKSDDFVQGGGLGLSICKEIVKRMDGSIRVESKVNRGTRFIVKIPSCPLSDKPENPR